MLLSKKLNKYMSADEYTIQRARAPRTD